jgi:hypothetical protein
MQRLLKWSNGHDMKPILLADYTGNPRTGPPDHGHIWLQLYL